MAMFGKSKPPDPSVLASRLRTIAEREPGGVAEKAVLRSSERASRQAVFRNATLTLDSGERITVALKNLSAGGARVEFLCHAPLPATFLLTEPMTKLKCRVRVVWQKDGAAGVRFTE
mgnify:CR=1 FL=1